VKNSALLVICSNRGLCGGYNASILREAMVAARRLRAENAGIQLELSGKRAIAFFRFQGIPAAATYTHFEDKPSFEEVEGLANHYLADYISGKVDRVEVAYMKFLTAARQTPVVWKRCCHSPRPRLKHGVLERQLPLRRRSSTNSYPTPRAFWRKSCRCRSRSASSSAFLDAAVSEQIARRVAMKAATENAEDIIKNPDTGVDQPRPAGADHEGNRGSYRLARRR